MKRVMFLMAAAFAVVLAPFWTCAAETQTAPKGSVTIFTDGMAAPGGRMAQAITELSLAFDKGRKLRLLSIMGYGGEANLRDLLRFRGADLAILNSDVLAGPAIQKTYPEAARKLRFVTRLRTQKAFLLARTDIASIDQLSGKTVAVYGPETIAQFTATTVFGLLKVKASIIHAQEGVDLSPPQAAQAVFLLEDEARRLLPVFAAGGDYHLIAIPRNAEMVKVYDAATIQPAEAGLDGGLETLPTIAVATIMATFDWTALQGRFTDVTTFVDSLFAALPDLRRDYPSSIWQETDPHADVPGWRRYDYAETARRTVAVAKAVAPSPTATAKAAAPSPAAPATAAPSPAAAAKVATLSPPATTKPATAGNAADGATPLRLSIVAYPPLTDQNAPGGGLIGELTIAAMERADPPGNRNIAFLWEKDKVAQVKTVLSDKAAELGVPWERQSCDDPRQLGMTEAAFCDGGLASEPLFKVLVLFFISADSDFTFANDESLSGRTICLPADRDLSSLGDAGRKLAAEGKLKLARPASLIECLDIVQRGDADAVLTNEMEGRLTISRLGLSTAFRMSDRAVGSQDVAIILAKEAKGADQLLASLNRGIAKLKSEELYSRIVAKYLTQINAGN